jgi:hypothetical protein
MKITLDVVTTSSPSMPAIGSLPTMPFIIGAKSLLPTGMFQGDISELVVTQSALTDADVQNFTEYARIQWSHLPVHGSADPCIDANGQPRRSHRLNSWSGPPTLSPARSSAPTSPSSR